MATAAASSLARRYVVRETSGMAKAKSKGKTKGDPSALSTVVGSERSMRAQGYKKTQLYSLSAEPVYGNMRWLSAMQSVGLSHETIAEIVNKVKAAKG